MENFEKKANTVGTQEAGKMLGLQAATVAQKCRNNELGQFTRNYTQTTKRGLLTTNKG